MHSLRALRSLLLPITIAAVCACGPPPAAPTEMPPPEPDPAGPTYQTAVRVVSALEPLLGLSLATMTVGTGVERQIDASGGSVIVTKAPGTVPLVVRHPAFLERETRVKVPADRLVDLSLIPSTLDFAAFEEFAPRANGLRRWTSNPRLVVLTHAVDFSGAALGFLDYPVIDRRMSDAQLNCLASGIAASLEDMSGGHLSWSAVGIQEVVPGSRFRTDQTPEGTIVVLPAISLGAGGRGTAYSGADSSVLTRGAVWMSVEGQNFCLTSLLYRHELGHALGYLHVTRRLSIMGVGLPPALTDFDRHVIEILFQRPPGNRTPDRDPSGASVNAVRRAVPSSAEPLR